MHTLYTVALYNVDGDIIRNETDIFATFTWKEHRTENSIYATAAAMVKETPTAAAFRVYPQDGVLLALRCAKTAAAVAANKGGKAASVAHDMDGTPTAAKAAAKASKQTKAAKTNTTQTAIYNDLRRISAGTAAALADGVKDIHGYVLGNIAAANHHTQDFFSVCLLAAYENENATAAERVKAIYKAANAYTYASRTSAAKTVSTEYIMNGGGDLVSWGTAAAYILKGGEKWTPTAAANMDTETAAALGECLAAAFATLTPTDRKIVRYIVNGYSQSQTAAALHYANKSTINRKVAIIRKAFADYIAANYPQFMGIVKQAETAAAATAAKTNGGENRVKRNARQAEYMRQRRAAAKAAKLAAASV